MKNRIFILTRWTDCRKGEKNGMNKVILMGRLTRLYRRVQ